MNQRVTPRAFEATLGTRLSIARGENSDLVSKAAADTAGEQSFEPEIVSAG